MAKKAEGALLLGSPFATEAKYALYRLIGLSPAGARYLDLFLSRRAYRKAFGTQPDLVHPITFSEKITARKLFDQRQIFPLLADKLWVRDFVASRLGEQFLPRLYAACDRFEDVDIDCLPDKFVIKTNHGTHWIIIVDDKRSFDRMSARRLVDGWLKANYYINSREIFYKNVTPKVMAEECLEEESGAPVIDYKFYIFDGTMTFFTISWRESVDAQRKVTFFDRARRQLPVQVEFPNSAFKRGQAPSQGGTGPSQQPALPSNLDSLIGTAELIGKGFDFIRVDLYSPGGRVLVGELTSLPNGGIRPFDPPEYDRIFGEDWRLVLSGPSP